MGSLTEHGDEGLGGPHRHGEDGARVLAFVRQSHVADADAELVGSGSNQLDPIITKGWSGRMGGGAFTGSFTFIFQYQAGIFGRRGLVGYRAGETVPDCASPKS